MKKVNLFVAFLVALSLFASTPTEQVKADHPWYHWGHGYSPLVTANCGEFGGSFCHYTGEAEGTWVNSGFRNGFRGGNPYYGCGPFKGWISVCLASSAELGAGVGGDATVWTTNNPYQHTDMVRVRVCSNCGFSHNTLHIVTNHEYGHAVGLYHTGNSSSVMYYAPSTRYPIQHDVDVLRSLYNGHWEG